MASPDGDIDYLTCTVHTQTIEYTHTVHTQMIEYTHTVHTCM